jgi:hypothetical protein
MADTEHQCIAEVVGYSCVFQTTPEGAIQHILKLISQKVGFEKDREFYRTKLAEMLDTYPLEQMSRFGAIFTEAQWRCILESVLRTLENEEQHFES